MTFRRILFGDDSIEDERMEPPAYFSDLNLDQVIDAITASKKQYNLKPFFYTALHNTETVRYRQEVMQDLEDHNLLVCIKEFAAGMNTVRNYLAMTEELDFEFHQKGWFLEATLVYCEVVASLVRVLESCRLESCGFKAFRNYMQSYEHSPSFQSLGMEARTIKKALAEVQYCVNIQGGKFKVSGCERGVDYSIEVEKTFEKFKQTAVDDFLVKLPERSGMSHIEAKILEFVARLSPEPFTELSQFCLRHNQFLDGIIESFDRDIQFYIAYIDFIAVFKREDLPFCYPQVSLTSKETSVSDGFDLALALSLTQQKSAVICNSFSFQDPERISIVTGPNQGGKTTFARMFGQLHHLASIGCPVPGRKARLFLFDQIFTHFEREEDIRNRRGKLEDDLIRIHDVFSQATSNSIFILNEIFSSTTLQDSVFLSEKIADSVIILDALCVWVTFIDTLIPLSEKMLSMVAMVDLENPTVRTFKIIRKSADGLAYALSFAKKHKLTYEQIIDRIT